VWWEILQRFVANFMLFSAIKEFLKSAKISQSYGQSSAAPFLPFLDTVYNVYATELEILTTEVLNAVQGHSNYVTDFGITGKPSKYDVLLVNNLAKAASNALHTLQTPECPALAIPEHKRGPKKIEIRSRDLHSKSCYFILRSHGQPLMTCFCTVLFRAPQWLDMHAKFQVSSFSRFGNTSGSQNLERSHVTPPSISV